MKVQVDMLQLLAQPKEGNKQFKNKKKNPQNFQKIKTYEGLTTKDLKKKH